MAGGCFIRVQPSGKGGKKISFDFRIALHIDDIATLQKNQLVLSQLAGSKVAVILIKNRGDIRREGSAMAKI